MIMVYFFIFLISYTNRTEIKEDLEMISKWLMAKLMISFLEKSDKGSKKWDILDNFFFMFGKRILGMADILLMDLLSFRIHRGEMISMFDVKNKPEVCYISLTYIFLITVQSHLLQY